jgi:hypothetical protein
MGTFFGRLALALCLGLSVAPAASAATLTLQWDANPEPGVTGYTLSYGTRSGFYDRRVDVGNVTSYTLTFSEPGTTTYYFAVTAYSAEGTSDYSDEIPAVVSNPIPHTLLTIDGPSAGSVVQPDLFLSGWTLDLGAPSGSGVDAVHVYAYPNPGSGTPAVFLGAGAYGTPRPDVAAAFGAQFVNSGFSLPVVGLAPGRYDLVVFARSTVTGGFTTHRVVPITLSTSAVAPGPQLYIDTPRTGDTIDGTLSVMGWAADLGAASGTGVSGVDLWAYPSPGSGRLPVFLGNAAYGTDRIDVAAIFGQRFRPAGYRMDVTSLAAGVYDLVAFPRSSGTGAAGRPRIARVTIRPSVLLAVDTPRPSDTLSGAFEIAGWALDRRATLEGGIDAVHVWAYPNPGSGAPAVFLGSAATGLARPDVGAAFGTQYDHAGYTLAVSPLAPGVYDIVVFGHSSVTGAFETATMLRVTVQ